jgi:hypothetical protein
MLEIGNNGKNLVLTFLTNVRENRNFAMIDNDTCIRSSDLFEVEARSSSSSFTDPPENEALRERLGLHMRALHHGSLVEKGEHLLCYRSVSYVIYH